MRLFRSIALIFVSVLFFQCQKEISYISDPGIQITTPEPITARLQGTVLDENGQPASGVSVKVGSQVVITDNRGYFRIMNASLDKKSSVVTAEKTGYFKAYRTFAATSGTNQVIIKLIKRTLAGTIDAATGGTVTLANGSKIELPASGVVVASNNGAYTGTVNVYAAYIDPTANDIDQTVPGSFMANDKNGTRVILSSYGMIAVELESSSAQKLQIKSGSKATLTTAIPSPVQTSSPSTIALWSVDEQSGIWKEEGTATKQGNVYVGEVSHFSFWNCDVSVNAILLNLSLKNTDGSPLVYAHVRIKRLTSYPAQANGSTDSLGQVSGYVPSNESLLLEVVDQCFNVIYSQNIGPFTQNTTLPAITISNTANSVITVTGTLLNCNGNPVTNGFAIIYYGWNTSYAQTDANGVFSTNFTTCFSTIPPAIQIIGIDNAALQQSSITSVPAVVPVTSAGNITACSSSSAQYINYTLDGTSYSIGGNPTDSLNAFVMTVGQGSTTSTTIIIRGFEASGFNNIYLKSSILPMTLGTYPMDLLNVQNFNQIVPTAPASTVTMTNFPTSPGQYYEGTFTAQFNSGGPHTLSGSFRIRN